jgi:GNAT superfamily N-acetyltransferase
VASLSEHPARAPGQDVVITGPTRGDRAGCEAVLRSLPEWFGIESSLLDYARSAETMPTFIARRADETVGFLTIKRHFPTSAEVYAVAVHREYRGGGIGPRLLRAAEVWLVAEGVLLLQVKTLGPSRPCAHYEETRRFYLRSGFHPLEEFPTLWNPANPCLVLVKPLEASRSGGA